jgi:hypothetical protein
MLAIFIRMAVARKQHLNFTIIFLWADKHLSSALQIRHLSRSRKGQDIRKMNEMSEIKLVDAEGPAYRFGGHAFAVQGAKHLEPLLGDDQTRDDESRLDVDLRKHARGKFIESWSVH